MGDRWNMHNDEIEARRYREETPWAVRLWHRTLTIGIAIGVPGLIFAAMIYGSR